MRERAEWLLYVATEATKKLPATASRQQVLQVGLAAAVAEIAVHAQGSEDWACDYGDRLQEDAKDLAS
jgi:hypothetical protein